jgi:acid stress-induced BolA-like protein IbaG/YrbA
MDEPTILARIQGLYPDARVEVAGEGCSFEVYVVTPAFAGVKTLERQRRILGLFEAEIATGKVHALGVKARTPEELRQAPGLVQIARQPRP